MKMQIRFSFKKNSDLHLMKMQICFLFKKKSDLHLIKMQIRFLFKIFLKSTSKEDAYLFFLFKKNSNLRLRKMQIYFDLRKIRIEKFKSASKENANPFLI